MPRVVAFPTPLFASLVVAALLALAFVPPARAADPDTPSASTDAYCYITVSNGQEYCYYYPPHGYDCDPIGTPSDPKVKNYTECSLKGVCYANMAGNTEVCYYLQPYGYQCYFKYDWKIIANMTHCDHLKSNLPPTITFSPGAGQDVTDEDTVMAIKWITIDDPDSRSSEPEDGYLRLTFRATRGTVGFDPSYIVDTTDRQAAVNALDQSLPVGERATFITGNGSLATTLLFTIRADPLQDLMKALVFLPDPNCNKNRCAASNLYIYADDQGNSGGIPEQAEGSINLQANAINDPPVVKIGNAVTPALITNEDIALRLNMISITDVDITEPPGGNGVVEITLTVTKGILVLPDISYTTCSSWGSPPVIPTGVTCQSNGGRTLIMRYTLSTALTYISTMRYIPDQDYFGIDTLTIKANDTGNAGSGGSKADTKSATITINSVNDAPTLKHPAALYVQEDTTLAFLNITVGDVDTSSGLAVKISVVHGRLSCPTLGATNLLEISATGQTISDIQLIFDTTTYAPDPNYNVMQGQEYLHVEVNDIAGNPVGEGLATIENIPLNVLAVNDPPELHVACTTPAVCSDAPNAEFYGTVTVAVGASRTFSSPGSDTAPYVWITDIDVGTNEMQVFIHVSLGKITIAPADLLRVRVAYPLSTPSGPFSTVMFFGTMVNVNAALNGMTYTRNSAGPDEITLLISDQGFTGLGKTGTDFITIALN